MNQEMEQLIAKLINGGILFDEAMQEFEKRFIMKMLDRHNNNLSKAAIALGIHRNTLSKRVEQYHKSNGANPMLGVKAPKSKKAVAVKAKKRLT
jgi:Fis family transcriptional regulator, factor for inversion stimulation protein